jgi:hypothetical protein
MGLLWRAALLPAAPLVKGVRAGSRGGGGQRQVSLCGGDILPLGRLAAN